MAEALQQRGSPKAAHDIDWRNPVNVEDNLLADFIIGQYKAGKDRRREWEADSAVQLSWVRGNQNLVWSDQTQGLIESQDPNLPLEMRDPIVINKLKGFMLGWLSLIFSRPLTWTVLPQTRDDEDVASARVQSKLMDYYWQVAAGGGGMTSLLDAGWLVFATGVCWAKPIWDPQRGGVDYFSADILKEKGETVESTEQRENLLARFKKWIAKHAALGSQEDVELEDDKLGLPGGDVDIEWVNGFDLTEPEACGRIETAPWIIHSKFRTIEYLRAKYGRKAIEGLEPDTESYTTHYQAFGESNAWQHVPGASGEVPRDHVLTHELWRPHIRSVCPVGVLAICTDNGRVLKKGPHPYVHGQLPFIQYQETPDWRDFRPTPTLRDLMGLQHSRNKMRSRMSGHVQMTVDPKYLVENGAGLPADWITSGPKEIPCKDATKISVLPQPTIPNSVYQVDDMNLRDMEDVAGLHRSTTGRGETPQQSGRHAALLAEADSRRLSIPRLYFEAASSKVGSQLLFLLWEFVSTARSVPITGPSGVQDIITFKGQDLLRGTPNAPHAFNVRASLVVEPDMAAVVDRIELLSKAGWLDPKNETDRQMVFRWLGEQVPSDLDMGAKARSAAERENLQLIDSIKQRAEVRVALGDRDDIHIETHYEFTTTAEYREALKKDAKISLAMELHLAEHHRNRAEKEQMPVLVAQRTAKHLAAILDQPEGGRGASAPPPGAGAPGNGRPVPGPSPAQPTRLVAAGAQSPRQGVAV